MVISLKTLWQGLVLMMYLKDNQYWCASSRCVLYSSKELTAAIHTVKHNCITSIIVTMRVLTTTCFGLHVGHIQVVIRLYQLYENAWKYSWEKRGMGGIAWSSFISGVVSSSMGSTYNQWQLHLYNRTMVPPNPPYSQECSPHCSITDLV